jgi:hypothetical protein
LARSSLAVFVSWAPSGQYIAYIYHTVPFIPPFHSFPLQVALAPIIRSFLFVMHSTMPVRPLPGASYHTLETVLHSFANVDLEAVGSFNAPEPSEKQSHPSNESTPLLDQTPDSRERNRRGLPLLLVILVFFCLAFTASAFLGYSAHRLLMPDVPDRHASIAEHLSSALQAPSYRMLVNENYDGALVTMCVHSAVV